MRNSLIKNIQLSLINPSEKINYVKIQFHGNSGRHIPLVVVMLEGRGEKNLKLSERIDTALRDGWVEITSTEIVIGGIWTNKGYQPLNKIWY